MKRLKNILTQAMLDVIAESFEEEMKCYDFDYTISSYISYRKICNVRLVVYCNDSNDVLLRDFAVNNEMFEFIKSQKVMLSCIGHDFASDIKNKLGEL